MKNLKICGQTHIENTAVYSGFAYDGEYFYLTAPQCREVHRYSENFEPIDILPTQCPISSLCYDWNSGNFWAIAEGEIGRILCLNQKFSTVSQISVRSSKNLPLCISSIAVKDRQNLIIAGNFGIAELKKDCNFASICSRDILQTIPTTSVAYCGNNYVSAISSPHGQSLCCGLFCDSEPIQSVLPCGYCLRDIAILSEENCSFYVLATKDYRQNFAIRCEVECQRQKNCEYKQSIACVINSISSIEESIAEILSAESRKIRRALQCADNCSEIIRINESVNKTISQVTQLEQVLCSKMNMAREFYNEL